MAKQMIAVTRETWKAITEMMMEVPTKFTFNVTNMLFNEPAQNITINENGKDPIKMEDDDGDAGISD